MFYLFLLAHLVADFILQPYWLVRRKQHWDGLLAHGAIVLICMLILALVEPAVRTLWPAILGITLVHISADWLKVHYGHNIPGPAVVSFTLDQVIHVATIAIVLSLALPAPQIWTLIASPFTHTAIYASAYVIAAFATPIAVIVWFDPACMHGAQSPGARLRSMCTGILAVSLTLFGGLLALPAILIGLAVAIHHPISSHPLDRPTGLLMVLFVATALGIVLTMVPV